MAEADPCPLEQLQSPLQSPAKAQFTMRAELELTDYQHWEVISMVAFHDMDGVLEIDDWRRIVRPDWAYIHLEIAKEMQRVRQLIQSRPNLYKCTAADMRHLPYIHEDDIPIIQRYRGNFRAHHIYEYLDEADDTPEEDPEEVEIALPNPPLI